MNKYRVTTGYNPRAERVVVSVEADTFEVTEKGRLFFFDTHSHSTRYINVATFADGAWEYLVLDKNE